MQISLCFNCRERRDIIANDHSAQTRVQRARERLRLVFSDAVEALLQCNFLSFELPEVLVSLLGQLVDVWGFLLRGKAASGPHAPLRFHPLPENAAS